MQDQIVKAQLFAKLHVKGSPVIIYNAWDGGSAKAIASCGAKVIATGDHPVGFAHGFGNDDFHDFTFDIYLPTIKEIASRIGDLPFSVDINNAGDLTSDDLKSRIRTVIEAGAVGINFEDGLTDGSGVLALDEQVKRIITIRETADELGLPLFINARTDIFIQAPADSHGSLVDNAIEKAAAFKEAGASGFFAPGLLDIELIKQLVSQVELPVNIIRLPGAPTTGELAAADVARISYGPVPQMAMIEWLKTQATAAISGSV